MSSEESISETGRHTPAYALFRKSLFWIKDLLFQEEAQDSKNLPLVIACDEWKENPQKQVCLLCDLS